MDPSGKFGGKKNLVAKLLLLGVFLVAARFAYVVTVHGETCDAADFCFFSTPGDMDSDAVAVSALTSSSRKAFVRAADGPPAWYSREWRKVVEAHSAVFQALLSDGYLSQGSKALCVGSPEGHEALALKEIGVADVVGVAKKRSLPLVVAGAGDPFRLPFSNRTFDFVFVGTAVLEVRTAKTKSSPFQVAAELQRVMKPGGVLVVRTSSAGDTYSLNSFTALFPSCALESTRQTDKAGTVREMVLRKSALLEENSHIALPSEDNGNAPTNKCSVVGGPHRQKLRESLVSQAEPLILEEPLKPWITLKRNIQNIKYLPTMADISFKDRYVYVDVGARSYGSSIRSWFQKQYPKQNQTFDIYAVEADKAFHAEYAAKKKQRVHLLPYAAWVRNETLKFEVGSEPGGEGSGEQEAAVKGGGGAGGKSRGMGRIQPAAASANSDTNKDVDLIQGLDFAEWLKNAVTERDFVVMKMDVEGTEFDLIPRLIHSGAICLVDELFLECHYNRWQKCCPGERSPKYDRTYDQCLELFTSLRESGVLVHQWW